MKYPKYLKPGSKISYVAPSLGAAIEPYITGVKNSKTILENKGFKVEYGPNTFGSVLALSNTKEKCAEELNHYFSDPETDLILSVGGGELMYEVMNYVDFEMIKKNPKWYIGFSDNTNITFLLPTLCDIATIYGPCARSFGDNPWYQPAVDSMNLLTGKTKEINSYDFYEKESLKTEENPFAPLNLTEPSIKTFYPNNNLSFEGRLLGGCLDILTLFPGTKFDKVNEFNEKYKEDGIIWFLEACDLNVMSIRRAMRQLDNANWFKYTKGFIIGKPLNANEDMFGINQIDAVLDVIKKYNVPIIFNADLGHLPLSHPLVTGSYAKVTTKDNSYKIKMEFK